MPKVAVFKDSSELPVQEETHPQPQSEPGALVAKTITFAPRIYVILLFPDKALSNTSWNRLCTNSGWNRTVFLAQSPCLSPSHPRATAAVFQGCSAPTLTLTRRPHCTDYTALGELWAPVPG